MINNIFIFAVALFFVIKGATMATKYAARLAVSYRLSKYTVGFIVIAVISILPEAFIAINSSLKGIPSFGLGMLFGSNIADLTLIISIIIFFARRGIKIESKILKNYRVYPFLLLLPLVLGLDAYYSRIDGMALIIAGAVFYYVALRNGVAGSAPLIPEKGRLKNFFLLILSMSVLLIGAHFTVGSASGIATMLSVSPILIGMLIVGLGTTMPELLFSIKSLQKKDDSLAIGDILGTVLADATIVVGILALVNPFTFPLRVIYITGVFMVIASILLFRFMKSGRVISKKEGYFLFVFWLIFVLVEIILNN
jgi:cation:H+ antiporter